MIGKTISHYKILEKLGEGGMGIVYKARDTKLEREVALKFLPLHLTKSETDMVRFIQEAKAAAALNHPNVCTIYEIQDEGENPFIVMEYVKGKTIRDVVGANGLSALTQAIDYAIQIAEALKTAHKKGIVHRDIKSENIMVTETRQIKVMDFGLAKLRGSVKLTKASSTIGTVAYMSPEHLQGQDADGRTDIFSFGVVLFEMLTGKLPFKGEYDSAMMYSIINEEPEPIQKYRSDLSSELLHVLNRALEKNPEERYQTVSDMLIDLKRIRKSSETVGTSPAASPLYQEKGKPSWIRLVIPAGITSVLILLFFLIRPLITGDVLGSAPVPISVITFDNQTGDAVYDRLEKVIPNLLITSLEQSNYLQVTTWQRMRDLLRQMGKENIDNIDEDLGFELCMKDGVNALVLGSVTKLGEVFVTDVKVLDVQTKELLTSFQSQGKGEESIIQTQIDELSKAISKGVGLSERRIDLTHRPIMDVTTTSIEAYNTYLQGRIAWEKFYLKDAKNLLEKAIALDTTFAEAYLYLAWTYGNLGGITESLQAYENAKRFSKKASIKEKRYIEAFYSSQIERDDDRTIQIFQEMSRQYPKEMRVFVDLAEMLEQRGHGEEAIEAYEHVLNLDPGYGDALNALAYLYTEIGEFGKALDYVERYSTVFPGDANPLDSKAEIYLRMGRPDDAILFYKKALERRPDLGSDFTVSYIYALSEVYESSIQWIEQYIANAPSIGRKFWGYTTRGLYHGWIGMFENAVQDFEKALQLIESTENTYLVMSINVFYAYLYFYYGKMDLAINHLNRWKEFIEQYGHWGPYGPNLTAYHLCKGMTEIKTGHIEAAVLELEAIERIQQKNIRIEILIQYYHDLLQLEIDLVKNHFDDAIRTGQKLDPPSFPRIIGISFGEYNVPVRKDGLARAYYAKGDIDRAIAEYERLTTFNPNDRTKFLIDPRDHYRLARLYEENGDIQGAVAEYEKVVNIWKNADKSLKEHADAKTYLARLKKQQ